MIHVVVFKKSLEFGIIENDNEKISKKIYKNNINKETKANINININIDIDINNNNNNKISLNIKNNNRNVYNNNTAKKRSFKRKQI